MDADTQEGRLEYLEMEVESMRTAFEWIEEWTTEIWDIISNYEDDINKIDMGRLKHLVGQILSVC